jgi:AAA domain
MTNITHLLPGGSGIKPTETDKGYTVRTYEPGSKIPTPIEAPPPANDAATTFSAKPFVWKDPSLAAKREWLYGDFLLRKTVSATIAPGGVGKSMLSIVEALSMATGYARLSDWVHQRCKVWLFNLEDTEDELERRFLAACKHYSIGAGDLDGHLFVNSGHDTPLVIATQTKNGADLVAPVVDAMEAEIRARGIDVLIIDPFVSCHQVNENDNGAIDAVAKSWAGIANRTGCAIHLVHHSKKTGGNKVEVEDARGASALINAVRSARVLNTMSKDEAEKAGVEDNHHSYVQITDGKANFAPLSDKSKWFKLEGVSLGNGGTGNLDDGDRVGVPVTWKWPEKPSLSDDDKGKILEHLTIGGPWRKDPQAKVWAGYGVIDALDLDPDNKAHKAQAKAIIADLLKSENLTIVKGEDEKRNPRDFIQVAS